MPEATYFCKKTLLLFSILDTPTAAENNYMSKNAFHKQIQKLTQERDILSAAIFLYILLEILNNLRQ